jgi:hypothetical protein
MPKMEGKQAKQAKADPLYKDFFSNILGSCGLLLSTTQRPYSDGEAKESGIELPALGRATTDSAPTVILPRNFYENLLIKYQNMPGQKGNHRTTDSQRHT